jgi:hypothetical protein
MRRLFVLIFIGYCLIAHAEQPSNRLVHPKTSSLTLSKLNKNDGSSAEFQGQERVSGTLIAQWFVYTGLSGVKKFHLPNDTPVYFIKPNAASQAVLPHLTDYPMEEIVLTNGLQALRTAVDSTLVDRFLRGEIVSVNIDGRFILQNYHFDLECDFLHGKATLVKIETAGQSRISEDGKRGC